MHASYAHRRVRHLRHYCQKWRDSARVTIDTPISTASRKLASVRRRSFVRHAQRRRLVSKLHVFFAFDVRECVDDSRCRHCFARVPGVDQSMFCLIAGAPLRAFLFGLELLSLSRYRAGRFRDLCCGAFAASTSSMFAVVVKFAVATLMLESAIVS